MNDALENKTEISRRKINISQRPYVDMTVTFDFHFEMRHSADQCETISIASTLM